MLTCSSLADIPTAKDMLAGWLTLYWSTRTGAHASIVHQDIHIFVLSQDIISKLVDLSRFGEVNTMNVHSSSTLGFTGFCRLQAESVSMLMLFGLWVELLHYCKQHTNDNMRA